jgi:hypothetical protein
MHTRHHLLHGYVMVERWKTTTVTISSPLVITAISRLASVAAAVSNGCLRVLCESPEAHVYCHEKVISWTIADIILRDALSPLSFATHADC